MNMIIQEAFSVPDEIFLGLREGVYKRCGGVIRWAAGPHKGEIVKHLKPVKVPNSEEAANSCAEGVLRFWEDNKSAIITGLIVTAVFAGAAGICIALVNHEPPVVKKFRQALSQYIDGVQNGTMELETIERLQAALEELKAHKRFEKYPVKLTADQIGGFISCIRDYTVKLALDNDFPYEKGKEDGTTIIDLEHYLNVQKAIFEAA